MEEHVDRFGRFRERVRALKLVPTLQPPNSTKHILLAVTTTSDSGPYSFSAVSATASPVLLHISDIQLTVCRDLNCAT